MTSATYSDSHVDSRPDLFIPNFIFERSTRMARRYWLIKSEPDVWSYDDHASRNDGVNGWDGVRNYQARNFLREMACGDLALFYHSNATPPHVAGIVEVVREAYPDLSALDPDSDYHDPKATDDDPRWSMVDFRAVRPLERILPLAALKAEPRLQEMMVLRKGSRLSVTPVTEDEFTIVLELAARTDER